ncbi:GIY-YIG nuclease family protein [Luteimonas sp. BDR2-5]|uniref:GIY-YIG nuclease family protein n=1 Tax=Proluteimonas luteida TaxID=2878685 RepID=UPI001E601813|nr:GIY-YIG nuclease family protein [Luteimonas sp. BDR2-5]MCD9026817.1 GIY-YIG nuclease family protein [Luteimonas sp. BDR2-5]
MSSGPCYLYVLPLAYEDILKVGISHDPLSRAQAFSRRYYEFFDLSRSLLVKFDTRREAQARETALHRQLCDWNAVQPVTVPTVAAGKTEWYRGAYAILEASVLEDIAAGRVVHAPAWSWWLTRLHAERDTLYEWVALMTGDGAWALSPHERSKLLVDALDAYTTLGVPLEGVVSAELMRRPLRLT